MSSSKELMQMEARRRYMAQQMPPGRSGHPDMQHMDGQRYHPDRPSANTWSGNPNAENTAAFPPY